jgi:apolipoprotein N-acyltransferase
MPCSGGQRRNRSDTTARSQFYYGCMRQLDDWAGCFVYSGLSALLLLLSEELGRLWFLSLIAIVPFLYKLRSATHGQALKLGLLFGASYFTVSSLDALVAGSMTAVFGLLAGTGAAAVCSLGINRVSNRYGFKPALVAAIWTCFEFCLMKLGVDDPIAGQAGLASSEVTRLAYLFGLLTISYCIVLLNSLFVIVFDAVLSSRSSARCVSVAPHIQVSSSVEHILIRRESLPYMKMRGPPSLSV